MINYTTPTLYARVKNIDISDGYDIYVSLEQGKRELEKSRDDLSIHTETHDQRTDTVISFMLSQAESAMFNFNTGVSMQINVIDATGSRAATCIKQIPVMRNLLDREITYGG